MTGTTNKHLVRAAAAAVLGSIAAACTTVQPPATQASVAPPPARPRVAVVKPAPAPAAYYRSMQQYEVALAKRIFEANRGHTVEGKLQPLLRAVVVLHFEIDGEGKVHDVRTWRTPEREAEHLARASLVRTGVLPVPPPQWLQGGRLGVTETWLFNSDGRFHLRALGPSQS
ncbi:MAG TPA: energy transducer TonB [Burkholderiales bacterium]|nr:energy transducer TonB [Burkholderiales bacterium]